MRSLAAEQLRQPTMWAAGQSVTQISNPSSLLLRTRPPPAEARWLSASVVAGRCHALHRSTTTSQVTAVDGQFGTHNPLCLTAAAGAALLSQRLPESDTLSHNGK